MIIKIKGRVARIESGKEFNDGIPRAQIAILDEKDRRCDSFTIPTSKLTLDQDVAITVSFVGGECHG